MSLAVHELLTRLLDVTPLPPAETDVEPLLAAFEDIIALRTEILDQLQIPLEVSDADRPLVRELEQRDAAWQNALTVALQTVGSQRQGTGQLRAYAAVI